MLQRTIAPTPPAPASPPLLGELWRLLWAHRAAVRQGRVFDRLRALVLGQLCAVARHTITQALLALGLVDADPSAFYRLVGRARLEYDTLARCYVRQTLADIPAAGPYVAVVDGLQMPRSSRTMPGTAWLKCPRTPPWKPGSHRAQAFVHLAALLPRWAGYSRALPLRLDAAFPPKAVPGAADPQTEGQAALTQVRWLRAELDAAGRRDQELLVLGDGHYDTVDLWTALPARTTLLARTACNRVLHDLPPVGARPNRRYGARAPRPDAWPAQRRGWQRTTLRVRGRDLTVRYRVVGPFVRRGAPGRPLFLLVVGGQGPGQAQGRYRRRRKPAFYLVNAVQRAGEWVLPLPAEELVAWAWQRWEVEVCHREMKSEFGVGEAQCWSAAATVRAVQVQAWAYAVCVLAGYRAWGYSGHPRYARGVWWGGAPRWSLRTLWRGYAQALHQAPAGPPARASARGTWAEMETWLHQMDRDAGGAAALVA